MVKPDVKSGCVGDITFSLTIRIKGKTLGERSRSSSFASSGIVWQPGVSACDGSEVSNPARIIAARESRSYTAVDRVQNRDDQRSIDEVFTAASGTITQSRYAKSDAAVARWAAVGRLG